MYQCLLVLTTWKNGTRCIPVLEKNGPMGHEHPRCKKWQYVGNCTVYRVPCTRCLKVQVQNNSFVWSMFFKQDGQLSLMQRSALVVEQVNHHFINCVVFAYFVLWKCFCPHLLKLCAWNRNSVQMIVSDQRSVRHARGTSLCQTVVFLNKWMACTTHFGGSANKRANRWNDVQTDFQDIMDIMGFHGFSEISRNMVYQYEIWFTNTYFTLSF